MLKITKITIAFLLIAALGGCGRKAKTPEAGNPVPSETPQESVQPTITPEATPASDNKDGEGDIMMEVPDLTSLDSITLIVNKQRPLGEDYEPADFVRGIVVFEKSFHRFLFVHDRSLDFQTAVRQIF